MQNNGETFLPENETSQIKKEKLFKNFEEISNGPKAEGLRPGKKYAGGDPDEIIIVDGIRYRKEVALMARYRLGYNSEEITRPYTEKEFFSHSTEDIGPGPGWDFRFDYLRKGWGIMDHNQLSDLPFYDLKRVE